MKLKQKYHRSTASDSNLIPMINVVFLLLIFFMIAGNIRGADPLSLVAPVSTGDQPVIAQSVLYVAVDGTLMLDDATVSMASLKATLASLKVRRLTSDSNTDIASQEPGDKAANNPQDAAQLAIKADARVTVSLLRDIMNAVSDAGLARVELLTTWAPADVQ